MDRHTLKEVALEWGADYFGVADLDPFRGSTTFPPDLLDPYRRAISLGIGLSRGIIDALADGPTPHYSHHYAVVNALLDQVALRLSRYVEKRGGQATPIPASQAIDRDRWIGAISHKAVARMAGLGWQGKSLLLVHPEVGPAIRLATILTDLDLPADQPMANRCGACRECVKACPAGAILDTPFGDGYQTRSAAWDADKCVKKVRDEFGQRPGVTPLICGVCIRACPFSRKLKK